jgi:hypothetical protein
VLGVKVKKWGKIRLQRRFGRVSERPLLEIEGVLK